MLGELHHGLNDQESLGTLVEVASEVHVKLEDLGAEVCEEVEAGVSGAKVVEGKAKAVTAVLVGDVAEVGPVGDLFDFGDFKDELVEWEVLSPGGFEGEADAGGGDYRRRPA